MQVYKNNKKNVLGSDILSQYWFKQLSKDWGTPQFRRCWSGITGFDE